MYGKQHQTKLKIASQKGLRLVSLKIPVQIITMARIQSTPIALSITCGIIALIALSPLAYIILKAVNSDFESWKWLLRWNTAIILWHSLLLSVTVTAASASIALPIALLTCRTNIRLRKFWDVTTVLP